MTDSIFSLLSNSNIKSLKDQVVEKYTEIGLSQIQFCKVLNVNKRTWQRIETGEAKKIDLSLIIKISQFLNMEVKDLIQLYIAEADVNEIKDLEVSKKYSFIVNNFDLKTLKKIGFIKNVTDFSLIEKRIKKFFNLESIYEYTTITLSPLYKRAKLNNSDKMLNFWLNLVTVQLKNIENPYEYDEEKLLSLIPRIRSFSTDVESGFAAFVKLLFECGVTVLVESYFSKTAIQGGTFLIKDKPFIVLTNFGNKYPNLWLTLAHELCHVIKDLDKIKKDGFHFTGENSLFTNGIDEEIADDFARQIFIQASNYDAIKIHMDIEIFVAEFAQKLCIHPSIIYFIHCLKNREDFPKYGRLLPKADISLKNIEIKNPWTRKNIQETIQQIETSIKKKPNSKLLPQNIEN